MPPEQFPLQIHNPLSDKWLCNPEGKRGTNIKGDFTPQFRRDDFLLVFLHRYVTSYLVTAFSLLSARHEVLY